MRYDDGATANDRFKRGSGEWFWHALTTAAVIHLVLFAFWPEMSAADMSSGQDELLTIELPPEIVIPPPPEHLARPAMPVVGSSEIDDDVTIPPTTFEYNTVDRLPSPPASTGSDDLDNVITFVPMTVRPQLKNQPEVERVLVRTYPSILRDSGIGGTPILWFLIDEEGRVLQTRVHTSSGYPALDEAAQKVATHMQFSPALNRDRRIKVWVEIPIVFTAR